jgi:hypothetical protein
MPPHRISQNAVTLMLSLTRSIIYFIKGNGKGKVHPRTGCESPKGE